MARETEKAAILYREGRGERVEGGGRKMEDGRWKMQDVNNCKFRDCRWAEARKPF